MKKSVAGAALLSPDAQGWRLRLPGGAVQTVNTLEEAAALIPSDHRIHLALPGHVVLVERLTLPSTNRDELAGMLQLQLEKTLPYPLEEISSDFEVIHQSENDSTLLSVAANAQQLEQLCAPLRSRARLPQKITLYAMHVAAASPADQTVLCIWPEDGQLQLAICENGKLGFVTSFPGSDAESLIAELPQMLLSAEMEGVPTEFASIRLESGISHLQGPLTEFFGKPVELISFDKPMPEPAGNLLPSAWLAETQRVERAGRLRQQLQIAAVAYLLLVAGAFIYLAWMKSRVQKLDAQVAQLQPHLVEVQAQQTRWRAVDAAVNPRHYAVEVLLQLKNNLPSPDVHLTSFNFGPTEFSIAGEAPDVDKAIGYFEKLKAEPALSDYSIEQPKQPLIDPKSGIVTFRFFGKL